MRKLHSAWLVPCLICFALAICGGALKAEAPAASEPQAVKVKPPPRITALEACPIAMRRAYEWDHGAQLIFATSRPFDFQLDGRSSRWGFRCIPTDGARVAAFSVNMAHPTSPVRVSKNAKRPPICLDVINRITWKIDSPEALEIARRNGLDDWLAKHPTFDLSYSGNKFELAATKRDGPFWLVSCTAKIAAKTKKWERIVFGISAVDGRLLFQNSSP